MRSKYDGLAVVDSRGNVNVKFFGYADLSLSVTFGTGRFDNTTRSATIRACALGLHITKQALLLNHDATRAATGGTGFGLGALLRTRATAAVTVFHAMERHLMLTTKDGLLELDGDSRFDIVAVDGTRRAVAEAVEAPTASAATLTVISSAAKAAKEGRENITEIKIAREVAKSTLTAAALRGIKGRVTVTIVRRALFRVGKNAVGLVQFLEFRLSRRIVGMQVGVIFLC